MRKKIAGKLTKNLKHDEQLKKIPMMTRRNNVMSESNDNIDYKNMVTTWIGFADEVKYFLKSIVFFLCYENARNSPLNQLVSAFLKFILC